MKRYIRSAEQLKKEFTEEERIRLFGKDPQGEIVIPNGYSAIGRFAFYYCESPISITIPDSVMHIDDFAFVHCKGLTNVNIPNGVTSIGNSAFEDCTRLTSITIPNSVMSIGDKSFLNCSHLSSLTIGNGVTSIGDFAFYKCSSLTRVTIPDSVTSIGEEAFYGCEGLTSVTISNSATKIGRKAFGGCSKLKSNASFNTNKKNRSNSLDLNTKINPVDYFPWDRDDYEGYSDEELLKVMEDEGIGIAYSLAEACEMYHDTCDDLEDALQAIEYDFGNDTGIVPLRDYDWRDQQDIYTQWLSENYPDELYYPDEL